MRIFAHAAFGLVLFSQFVNSAVNPIRIELQSASTTLTSGSTGYAYYVVTLDSHVPGTLYLSYKGGMPKDAIINNGSTSLCSGVEHICGNNFSLNPGDSCCLAFSLNPGQNYTGDYILQPIVGTTPATYQGQAAPYALSVSENQYAIATGSYSSSSVQRPLLALSENNGANWIYPSSINAPVFQPNDSNAFSGNGNLFSSSCSGNICITAGSYSNNSTIRPLLAVSKDSGISWTYLSSINAPIFTPDNSNAFGDLGSLSAASCAGSICIAAGLYTDINTTVRPLLALSQNGGTTWVYPSSINSPVFTPHNTNAFDNFGILRSAYCRDNICIAVGYYFSQDSIQRPLLAVSRNYGNSWEYPTSITDPTFTPNNYPFTGTGTLNAVSCNGIICIAVGNYTSSGTQRPLLAVSRDSGVTWVYSATVNDPQFTPSNTNSFTGGGTLNAVSCFDSLCIAGGAYLSSGIRRPLLAVSQDSGVTWKFPSSINEPYFVPNNPNAFSYNGIFRDVSCTNNICIAAGSYNSSGLPRPLLALSKDVGLTWTYPASINAPNFTPDNTNIFSYGKLMSASCNSSFCIAVGEYNDSNSIERPLLALTNDAGTTWTYPSSINAPVFFPNNANAFSSAGNFYSATTPSNNRSYCSLCTIGPSFLGLNDYEY